METQETTAVHINHKAVGFGGGTVKKGKGEKGRMEWISRWRRGYLLSPVVIQSFG